MFKQIKIKTYIYIYGLNLLNRRLFKIRLQHFEETTTTKEHTGHVTSWLDVKWMS